MVKDQRWENKQLGLIKQTHLDITLGSQILAMLENKRIMATWSKGSYGI